MSTSTLRTIYVVCFEQPGSSGGFEWRYDAVDAREVHDEVLEWSTVRSGEPPSYIDVYRTREQLDAEAEEFGIAEEDRIIEEKRI